MEKMVKREPSYMCGSGSFEGLPPHPPISGGPDAVLSSVICHVSFTISML